MDLEETQNSFICMDSSFDYKEGKLKLALPFYCEYGDDLPQKLNLHVKNGPVWEGKFNPGSFCIEGLQDMMRFYGLKGSHLAILQFVGGGDFNLKFYNAYAVEMKLENEVPVSNSLVISSAIEEDKLWSTFLYNAFHNFAGLYNLKIERKHLLDQSDMKVLSPLGCYQLGLTDSVKFVKIGFEKHEWKIKLKWLDGEAYFSKKWCDFVKAVNVSIGDVVTIYKTWTAFDFKVAIFEKNIVSEQPLDGEGAANASYANFFKIMNLESLDEAELELPRVFRKKFGHTLSNSLHIELGAGYSTKFKYCPESKKIYGLQRFIRKFDINDGYVLFFNYLGNSRFGLEVYDTQRCNHLRDVIGDLRFEDFMYPPCDMEVVDVSDDDEDIFQPDQQVNEEVFGNERMSFTVSLIKSHVDQQGHGVYIPRFMWTIYQNWRKRTNVTLRVGGREWKVDILRSQRQFRFGKGWDAFTMDNGLVVGQEITFQFVGDSTFQVTV